MHAVFTFTDMINLSCSLPSASKMHIATFWTLPSFKPLCRKQDFKQGRYIAPSIILERFCKKGHFYDFRFTWKTACHCQSRINRAVLCSSSYEQLFHLALRDNKESDMYRLSSGCLDLCDAMPYRRSRSKMEASYIPLRKSSSCVRASVYSQITSVSSKLSLMGMPRCSFSTVCSDLSFTSHDAWNWFVLSRIPC